MNKQDIVIKWLNKGFGNLTEVVKGSRTFYVGRDRKPLFFYRQGIENGYVYINYDKIWVFFESIFGLNTLQTKEIMAIWLGETYNLRGVTPKDTNWLLSITLGETYNIKKYERN